MRCLWQPSTAHFQCVSGWRITAGVQNIFDADFPFFDSYAGVDSTHLDFRRRVAFVDISKEFSW